jgi:hypothetical protein
MARRGRQTTAALEAKHQRQAERLRRHYDDFVKDGMFHEAAEILSVSQHLNPEFESLIAEAKRAATGGGALQPGPSPAPALSTAPPPPLPPAPASAASVDTMILGHRYRTQAAHAESAAHEADLAQLDDELKRVTLHLSQVRKAIGQAPLPPGLGRGPRAGSGRRSGPPAIPKSDSLRHGRPAIPTSPPTIPPKSRGSGRAPIVMAPIVAEAAPSLNDPVHVQLDPAFWRGFDRPWCPHPHPPELGVSIA